MGEVKVEVVDSAAALVPLVNELLKLKAVAKVQNQVYMDSLKHYQKTSQEVHNQGLKIRDILLTRPDKKCIFRLDGKIIILKANVGANSSSVPINIDEVAEAGLIDLGGEHSDDKN